MATKTCPDVGRSNVQAVWAEIEDVSGVLQKPTPAGYIVPRGNASMNQVPTLTDSEELSESLNVTAQFQDAVGAGDASIPTYLRLAADGVRMQAHALMHTAMGEYQAGGVVTAEVDALDGIAADATEIPLDGVTGGVFPPRGLVRIGDEIIRYHNAEVEKGVPVKLVQCARGYMGTTPEAHADDASIILKSACYYQSVCRHTVSLWVKNDHLVTWGSGGTVTATEFVLSRESGQQLNYSLQFRRMGWAGRSFIKAIADNVLTVETSKGGNAAWAYTEGSYILNTTQKDDNGGAGYRITGVNHEAGTITLDATADLSAWTQGDRLDAWTPKSEPIGEPVESRSARVFVHGLAGALREGSFSMGTPAEFLKEIDDEYPGESLDTKRDISLSLNGYLRASDAQALGRGYEGFDAPMALVFGRKEGRRMSVHLPRVKMNMPEIAVDGAAFTLERTGRVLGTLGEDAVYVVME